MEITVSSQKEKDHFKTIQVLKIDGVEYIRRDAVITLLDKWGREVKGSVTAENELHLYMKWCNENCTKALRDGIALSVENYKKANSR